MGQPNDPRARYVEALNVAWAALEERVTGCDMGDCLCPYGDECEQTRTERAAAATLRALAQRIGEAEQAAPTLFHVTLTEGA